MRKDVLIVLTFALLPLCSCSSFLDPGRDNAYTLDMLLSHPAYAEGVLLNCYNLMPGGTVYQDAATDNAVINLNNSPFRLAATGGLSSTDNAFSVWDNAYTAIAYANHFLTDIVDKVRWSEDDWKNAAYRRRLSAEAHGMRAYYYILLLEAHAGVGTSGSLLGVPLVLEPESVSAPMPQRGAYEDCLAAVLEDLDYAIDSLPYTYANAPFSDPDKAAKDAVFGAAYATRMCGAIAMALKARVLYDAATPAFNPDGDLSRWSDAADAAAALIDRHGGLTALYPGRIEYYLDENCSDVLWRKSIFTGHNWETDNFPPSLYGNGRVNPSQELVDAFPAANGYPISNPLSLYNPSDPYSARDPRLEKYILHHGSAFKTVSINTVNDASDGVNRISQRSTRSGYYQKKLMDPNVSLVTGNIANTRHFVCYLRYTELYLIYAEAAFEAWGPDGKGSHAYSSREVLAALRQSAGIAAPDVYLASLSTAGDYRSFVLNERRLELCFENFRYWDIRRHMDLSAMKASVSGTADGGLSSSVVEARKYEDYMIYGPVPYTEVMKGLEQNQGWK